MKTVSVIFLIAMIYSSLPLSGNEAKTYEGIAERSKAGLVVGGVMITSLTEEEMKKYTGKLLRVRGIIDSNHRWRVSNDDPVKKQGFNMPVMYKIISIEVIKN